MRIATVKILFPFIAEVHRKNLFCLIVRQSSGTPSHSNGRPFRSFVRSFVCRWFVRSLIAIFFRRCDFFFDSAKIFEKLKTNRNLRENSLKKIGFAHRSGALAHPWSRELRAVKIPASYDAWRPPKRRQNHLEKIKFFGVSEIRLS